MTVDAGLAARLLESGPLGLRVTDREHLEAAELIGGEWTVKLALARTKPPQPQGIETTLVMSRLGDVVLAERVVGTARHRRLLHREQVPAVLAASVESPVGAGPGQLLPDRALDPVAAAAGRWDQDILAVLATAGIVFEAAYATPDEPSRSARTVVTCLVCEVGIVSLEQRPLDRTLTFRHRDTAGTAALLAELLLR